MVSDSGFHDTAKIKQMTNLQNSRALYVTDNRIYDKQKYTYIHFAFALVGVLISQPIFL